MEYIGVEGGKQGEGEGEREERNEEKRSNEEGEERVGGFLRGWRLFCGGAVSLFFFPFFNLPI